MTLSGTRCARWTRLALLCVLACPFAQAGVTVTIEGLPDIERQNVELRLGLNIQAQREALDEAQLRRLHAQAEADIRAALEPFGYYHVTVAATLDGAGQDWRAHYRVNAGPPTTIQTVDLQIEGAGAGLPELEAPASALRSLHGARLLHAHYEELKSVLATRAYALGFLDVSWTRAELRVNTEANRADVRLTLATGERYTFGPLRWEAPGLDEVLLTRYVDIVPGAVFEPQKLLDAQFALADLDYFESIELVPLRAEAVDAAKRQIPVLIRTTLRPRHRNDVGIGYGTDTGVRLSFADEVRRLNTRGHRLRSELRLSEIKNSFSSEYRVPTGRRAVEQIAFSVTASTERFEDGDNRKWGLAASLSRLPGDWQRKTYLAYEHEESELGQARQTSDLLLPGLSVSRGEQDNAIHTRRGWHVFADVHGTSQALLSTTSFLQLKVAARAALPLGRRGRLIGRFEQGASLVDEFNELPASQRFFAGGDQSVRGYRYQSLGPVDASGKVIGGKYLAVYGLEADHPVWGNWGVAAFADLGGAGDEPSPKLYAGLGLGLRYRAPIGFVQLDLAHPLDGDSQGVRVHVGVRVGL